MAATNVREFTAGLDAFKNHTEQERRRLTKAVGLRALRGLVLGTRVDTGRARGNYQVAEGRPPEGEIERFDRTGKQGSADTIAIGSREILAMEGDDVLWIHNGVPYIGVLEERDKMLAGNVAALRTWLRSL